jgi:hypothetical protein
MHPTDLFISHENQLMHHQGQKNKVLSQRNQQINHEFNIILMTYINCNMSTVCSFEISSRNIFFRFFPGIYNITIEW